MRFVFDYRMSTGTLAIMIFSAEDEEKAEEYVQHLIDECHYQEVSGLCSIVTIDDLYRRDFPRKDDV